MATPKVLTLVSTSWTDVIGGAASVANTIWQNLGPNPVLISFTTSAPAGGSTDGYFVLKNYDAYLDTTGSAHCWVKTEGGASRVSAISA